MNPLRLSRHPSRFLQILLAQPPHGAVCRFALALLLSLPVNALLAQEPEPAPEQEVAQDTLAQDTLAQEETTTLSEAAVAQDAGPQPLLGDVADGSRATPVHLIKLFDEHGTVIKPWDRPLLPFSTRQTCGPCHNYNIVRTGWHFNAADSGVDPGRRGQPWILTDALTTTQIPLSFRPWPGAYHPDSLGLTAMAYITAFGRQMPGGSVGDDEAAQTAEQFLRWQVSGKLEINCLACHDIEAAQDQAEFASQVLRQNFRWAATASSGFATVRGAARDMPDNYDIYLGLAPDLPEKIPPTVHYDRSRFNDRSEVFFNLSRRIPNQKCYFCHSTSHLTGAPWQESEDVHLTAGMQCVDCHRNGLDHAMNRGYAGEVVSDTNFVAAGLTCSGCHLPEGERDRRLLGRRAAPVPAHAGLPPIHFEKLTCTACHAGRWPDDAAARIKTAMAHALGTHEVNRSATAPPALVSPVFVKGVDGKIAPHHLLWPSFWALEQGAWLQPLLPERVRPLVALAVAGDTTRVPGEWPALADSHIVAVLQTLAADDSTVQAVYVSGGRLHRLSADGRLRAQAHPAAEPYSWAFGHDVRPASQSLGAGGCDDCHATAAPFYFGRVPAPTALTTAARAERMTTFLGSNAAWSWLFSASFALRPLLKSILLLGSVLLCAIVLYFIFAGLGRLLKMLAP